MRRDGIAFEGKLWLVPQWLQHNETSHAMPERIIRFDDHHYQATPGQEFEYQNILLPISESTLDGALPANIEYRDRPSGIYVDSRELARIHPESLD